jgi:restriction system protein
MESTKPKEDIPFVPDSDSAMPSLIQNWRQQHVRQFAATIVPFSAAMNISVSDPIIRLDEAKNIAPNVDILLQATLVVFGDRTKEGDLISGVAIPWFEILSQIAREPDFLFKVPWRKLEELIAGAYERAGWPEVVLTPRSGDGGSDIIASRRDVGSIRILDQIKAYKPGHVVTADEVRSMQGVLSSHHNVSKGIVTTTSRFAPGISKDPGIQPFIPNRLELRGGQALYTWLRDLLSPHKPD